MIGRSKCTSIHLCHANRSFQFAVSQTRMGTTAAVHRDKGRPNRFRIEWVWCFSRNTPNSPHPHGSNFEWSVGDIHMYMHFQHRRDRQRGAQCRGMQANRPEHIRMLLRRHSALFNFSFRCSIVVRAAETRTAAISAAIRQFLPNHFHFRTSEKRRSHTPSPRTNHTRHYSFEITHRIDDSSIHNETTTNWQWNEFRRFGESCESFSFLFFDRWHGSVSTSISFGTCEHVSMSVCRPAWVFADLLN